MCLEAVVARQVHFLKLAASVVFLSKLLDEINLLLLETLLELIDRIHWFLCSQVPSPRSIQWFIQLVASTIFLGKLICFAVFLDLCIKVAGDVQILIWTMDIVWCLSILFSLLCRIVHQDFLATYISLAQIALTWLVQNNTYLFIAITLWFAFIHFVLWALSYNESTLSTRIGRLIYVFIEHGGLICRVRWLQLLIFW